MATQNDVRKIALSLPKTVEAADKFAFSVVDQKGKAKGFAWAWNERIHPKKARVPNAKVLVVRVANEVEKEMLLAADAARFFTEPHYNGYNAVLVRLDAVTVRELKPIIVGAWRCQAPPELVAQFDGAKPKRRIRP